MKNEKLLKQKVINILEEYGYRVKYTPYHTQEDIKIFSHIEKNIDTERYFTVFNEGGYVVCRLPKLRERSQFTRAHVEKICEAFSMFEIIHRDVILEQLKKL